MEVSMPTLGPILKFSIAEVKELVARIKNNTKSYQKSGKLSAKLARDGATFWHFIKKKIR